MKTFLLEFKVVGIENPLMVMIEAETLKKAHDCACEIIVQIKHGDIEMIKSKELGR
jgi:hypothetical protein